MEDNSLAKALASGEVVLRSDVEELVTLAKQYKNEMLLRYELRLKIEEPSEGTMRALHSEQQLLKNIERILTKFTTPKVGA